MLNPVVQQARLEGVLHVEALPSSSLKDGGAASTILLDKRLKIVTAKAEKNFMLEKRCQRLKEERRVAGDLP
jgi:hypothetical protein